MRPVFDDPALVEHHDPVHPRHGREPVRDGDHGLARHHLSSLSWIAASTSLSSAEVASSRIRIGASLRIRARARCAAAVRPKASRRARRHGRLALRPASPRAGDEFVRMRLLRGRPISASDASRPPVADVVPHRAVQQRRLLRHHRNLRAQAFLRLCGDSSRRSRSAPLRSKKRRIRLTSVDLPAPERPTRPIFSPGRTLRLKPSSTA